MLNVMLSYPTVYCDLYYPITNTTNRFQPYRILLPHPLTLLLHTRNVTNLRIFIHNSSGICTCKDHVEGRRCRECKPGYFNLDVENEFGCTPCFCYGHSSECSHAPGYSKYQIESTFAKNNERWKALDERGKAVPVQFNAMTNSIGVSATGPEFVYFSASERYLGDQRASYNQILKFSFRIGENNPRATAMDIELEGSGAYVRNSIFAQRNPLPTIQVRSFFCYYEFNLIPRL